MTVRKKVRLVLGLVALAVVLAACSTSSSLPQNSPDQQIRTANIMHIPVGENVYVSLCSAGTANPSGAPYGGTCGDQPPPGVGDAVIHSFWVPALNGKQDVVPGRTNHLTLYAEHP